jgi:hypothetical protein
MSRWQRILAAPVTAGRSIGRGVVAVAALFDFRDILLFGGTGLLGYGLYQVYAPAAFIVPGAIFVAVATIGAR